MTPVRRKICVVVASRANYARIKSALRAIDKNPNLELQVILAASAILPRFSDLTQVMREDGIVPSSSVYMIIEGENPTTMAKSTGLGIVELATQFDILKPDIVLTIADRFETMATAIAASYMNIPLAHTQGGDVTGSIDESVRHAISKLAHIHFPATELSKDRLIKMGEDPASVFVTGCPSIDLLTNTDLDIDAEFFLKLAGVGQRVKHGDDYLVVLQHPVTTEYGRGYDQIKATLDAVHRVGKPTIWLWPNVDAGSDDVSKGLRSYREHNSQNPIFFIKNVSPEDYARLISNCSCLIGNSSSAIREGCFLGVPAVNIGTRQHRRERGHNVVDAEYCAEDIHNKIQLQLSSGKYSQNMLFGDGHAGEKIASHLSSVNIENVQKILAY